jgi:hypothetical protein
MSMGEVTSSNFGAATCTDLRSAASVRSIRHERSVHGSGSFRRLVMLLLVCSAIIMLVGSASAAEPGYTSVWARGACSAVSSVAVTADGSTIVAGAGNTVYLLDRDGNVLWTTVVGSRVQDVGISPEGSYIGVAADKLYLFDADGDQIWNVKTTFIYRSVALSSNGSYIVAGCDNGALYLFDREKNTLWDYDMATDAYGVAISDSGRYIVTGCDNQGVYLLRSLEGEMWSYGTGKLAKTVSLTPDGYYVAAGSYDRCVYFSTSQGEHLWKFPTEFPIQATALSGEALEVFAASDTLVFVLDRLGSEVQRIDLGTRVEALAASKDGSLLVVGTGSGGQSVHLFSRDGAGAFAGTGDEPDLSGGTAGIYPGPQAASPERVMEMSVEVPDDTSLASQMFGWVENVLSLLFKSQEGFIA